jgi:hypothetical protein
VELEVQLEPLASVLAFLAGGLSVSSERSYKIANRNYRLAIDLKMAEYRIIELILYWFILAQVGCKNARAYKAQDISNPVTHFIYALVLRTAY